MVTLTEPQPINVADNRPDGSQAPAKTRESISRSQFVVPAPSFETFEVDTGKVRTAGFFEGIAGIYDWLTGPGATRKQRIALEVDEINESRAARVMALEF